MADLPNFKDTFVLACLCGVVIIILGYIGMSDLAQFTVGMFIYLMFCFWAHAKGYYFRKEIRQDDINKLLEKPKGRFE